MVAVAILHVWNKKYGPQVSLDCNVGELIQDIYNKNWESIEGTITAQTGMDRYFTYRIYSCNLILGRVFLFLLFVCAVLLHGFSTGEVNGPAGDLSLRLPIPMFFHLHPLTVLLSKLITMTMIVLQKILTNCQKTFLTNKEHSLR